MNYRELSGLAQFEPWAAKMKEAIDHDNLEILATRQAYLLARQGIGVGDFVLCGENILRIAHVWDDCVQLTDGRYGSSFYLGDSYVSYSGALDPEIPKERFAPTEETRRGPCWFFSRDDFKAHNGFHTEADFHVWKLTVKA